MRYCDVLAINMRYLDILLGCFDHKGNCRPFGSIITDNANPCIKYECTGFGYFSPIATG
jgi:hypothetical protein